MSLLKQIETLVGSVPQGSKYLWFDADTLVYLAALIDAKFDLPLECADRVLIGAMDRFKGEAEKNLGFPLVVVPCLSSNPTFRHKLNPNYKANRIGKWKPPLLGHYTAVYKELYPCFTVDEYEADDLVGILHSQIPNHVLCSGDKDLQQFPGTLYNPRTLEVRNITLTEALRFRLYQWIVGDMADGYGGCAGIGEVKGGRLLDEYYNPSNVSEVIEAIQLLYDIQNKKEEAKGRSPRDPSINFQMSQILYSFDRVSDPLLFLGEWKQTAEANGFSVEV